MASLTTVPAIGVRRASSGGGGTSGTDHFAPRIIVGNVLAGDPSADQVAPFRYIPDPGDGSGIALALSEAAADQGDVFVRSGTYTLPSGTAVLDVPADVTLRGAGWDTVINGADDQRAVFRVAERATLADLRIVMPVPAAGATGDLVVEMTGSNAGSATVENVYVDATAGLSAQLDESLIGGIGTAAGAPGAVGPRVIDCVVLGSVYSFQDPASVNRQFACYSFPDADQAVIRGQGLFGDYLLRLTGSASRCLVDLQGENYRTAILSGTWHQLRLTGITFAFSFDPTPYAVHGVNMQRCDLTAVVQGSDINPSVQALVLDENSVGNRVALTCETYGTGATVEGSKNILSGISVDAGLGSATDGVVFTVASSNNVLIGGVLDALTPITDAGTTNEIAHTV